MALLVSGCIEATTSASAPREEIDQGGIAGIATDDAFQPLTGVQVVLLQKSTPVNSTTSDLGRFSFSDLSPGGYELQATLEGYVSVSRRVEVLSGAPTPVAVELAPIPIDEPYTALDTFAGIMRCAVATPFAPTGCCNAWEKTDQMLYNTTGAGTGAACPSQIPHDEHVILFDVPLGHRALVGETTWDARSVAMSALYSVNRTTMLAETAGFPVMRQSLLSGTNHTTNPSISNLGTVPDATEAFRLGVLLNYNGDLQAETQTALGPVCSAAMSTECSGVGVATEHRFTHYLTVFVNEAPASLDEYSALKAP